jgi:hypothetical protein
MAIDKEIAAHPKVSLGVAAGMVIMVAYTSGIKDMDYARRL